MTAAPAIVPQPPQGRPPTPQRVLSAILYTLAAIFVVQSTHHFFAYVDHYPYWSLDDGLAVISTSLLQVGRYGDPAVPLEPFSGAQRYHGFYNYGPWYFFTGAGLVWLFGFSIKALRSIHLLAALSLVLVGRRLWTALPGAIATTIVAVGVCWLATRVEWPMFRPDPFMTLFAAILIWAAARATITGRSGYWFVAGLAAGCAAFSHLVAGTLIPASLAIVMLALLCGPRRGAWLRWTTALMAGWCASAVLFYASFGFRFRDHLRLILSYRSTVRSTTASALGDTGPLAVWREHYRIASSGVAGIYVAGVALALLVSLVLIVRAVRRRDQAQVQIAALIVPGVTVFAFYVVGLGLYQNFHTGYVILPQLIGVWVFASLLYVVMGELRRWRPAIGHGAELLTAVVVALLVARLAVTVATADDDPRIGIAHAWVGITPYMDEVLGTIPHESVAWGSYSLAAEGPRRIQLVSMETALRVMPHVPAARRLSLAPDFIVWGHPQTTDAIVFPLSDPARDPLALLHALLPQTAFAAAALTSAVPYGATRVFARQTAGAPDDQLPLVSAWDASLQRWLHRPVALTGVTWSSARGTLHVVKAAQQWTLSAADTAVADLAEGWYLFRVGATPAPRAELIVAGRGAAHEFAVGDLPPLLDVAPRLAAEPVYLLQHHEGGALGLNLFSADAGARLGAIETFRVIGVEDYRLARERAAEQPLPALAAWRPAAADGVTAQGAGESLVVQGNASPFGYQLVSARVDVLPGAQAAVRLPLTLQAGHVCTGVLDEQMQHWLVPPADAAPVHRFSTAANRAVFLVLANCNNGGQAAIASRFTVGPGAIAVARELGYAEELMRSW